MEELELTYLVKELPAGLKKARQKEVFDIYVPSTIPHPTLRIRKNGDKYEITKKEPITEGDASRQLETTIPLKLAEFDEFEKLVRGKRVRKIRYYYEENGVTLAAHLFRNAVARLEAHL